jgi:hypothetical protein
MKTRKMYKANGKTAKLSHETVQAQGKTDQGKRKRAKDELQSADEAASGTGGGGERPNACPMARPNVTQTKANCTLEKKTGSRAWEAYGKIGGGLCN